MNKNLSISFIGPKRVGMQSIGEMSVLNATLLENVIFQFSTSVGPWGMHGKLF